jgi:hypothetical protein
VSSLSTINIHLQLAKIPQINLQCASEINFINSVNYGRRLNTLIFVCVLQETNINYSHLSLNLGVVAPNGVKYSKYQRYRFMHYNLYGSSNEEANRTDGNREDRRMRKNTNEENRIKGKKKCPATRHGGA